MPRPIWKKARIDELIPGRDGHIRTFNLRLPDRTKIIRPVQLVVPLEIDQGGEDVEDWNIFLIISWWVIRDFVLFCSNCIFFVEWLLWVSKGMCNQTRRVFFLHKCCHQSEFLRHNKFQELKGAIVITQEVQKLVYYNTTTTTTLYIIHKGKYICFN